MVLNSAIPTDTSCCIGTDLHALTRIGLLGWEQGYELAEADAPHFRSEVERQQSAESSCRQSLAPYALMDVLTLQRAYIMGWLMGYAMRARGDVWAIQRRFAAEVGVSALFDPFEGGVAAHG